MSQYLTLPLNRAIVSAGYKSAAYRKVFGWPHCGADLVDAGADRRVLACGAGRVEACGPDAPALTGPGSRLGNVIVVVYPGVVLADGTTADLTCRMYHLESIRCRAGDTLARGDLLGEYGSTGAHTTGRHLHIEFDTDTRWPALAPGIRAGGRVINRTDQVRQAGGVRDSTLAPARVLRRGPGQSLNTYAQQLAQGWVSPGDLDAAALPAGAG